MRKYLIPDWKKAWRMFSVLAASLLTVLSLVQAEVLPLFQFAVPPDVWPWVSAGFGVAIVVLRLVAQPSVSGAPAPLAEGENHV